MPADFDSPWKEALDKFFHALLDLCFPKIASEIDWTVAPEFLDTELHEILRGAIDGRQHVDKLARITLLNGEARRILLHVEVQHWPDKGFPARLYSYHKRLEEKAPVATVAILADTDKDWKPSRYDNDLLGCRVIFDFPICKLLDLLASKDDLEKSQNPAAMLVLANWAAQQTGSDAAERYRWKRQLMRSAYEKGFRREDILELYRFIDWLLQLPKGLEESFRAEILKEEEHLMPYVTSFERLAKEEGRQEGLEEGRLSTSREVIKDMLLVRFGNLDSEVIRRIESETDLDKLTAMRRLALTSEDLAHFLRSL